MRFESLADAKVGSLYGSCLVPIVLVLASVDIHPHFHNWVALDVNTHIANLLANDDSVFYRNIPAIEITYKFAERLRTSFDIHRQRVGYFLLVLHHERTTAERQTIGMNACRQMFKVYGTHSSTDVVDVLHEPSVAFERNRKRIGKHLRIVEYGILVFNINRKIIRQSHRLVVDEYRQV